MPVKNSHECDLNNAARLRLRQLRQTWKLSRPKFADLLGIPPTTLKNYELAYREIGGGLFLIIANHPKLAGCSHWLLTGQGNCPLLGEA